MRLSARRIGTLIALLMVPGVLLVDLLLAPVAPMAIAGSYQCIGAPADEPNGGLYPEPRVFLESQSWWRDPHLTGVGRHIHDGACFPLLQRVTGTMKGAQRVLFHDNAGVLTKHFHGQIWYSGGNTQPIDIHPGWTCSVADCKFWQPWSINLGSVPDGHDEWRFQIISERKNVSGANARQYPTTGWLACVDVAANCPVSPGYGATYQAEARSWYDVNTATSGDLGYVNVSLRSAYPWTGISGTWSVTFKFGLGAGGTGAVSRQVNVNPAFHESDPGIVIQPETSGSGTFTFKIDTTKLPNGVNNVVAIAHATQPDGGRNSVAFRIPFVVKN